MSPHELRLVIGAGVLVLVHGLAPGLFRLRERVAKRARSFGGGMAVSYVFVHLLPELDLGHAVLGRRIHVLVLAGFLLVYGLEHRLAGRAGTPEGPAYAVRLGVATLYNGLIVFTLGTQVPDQVGLAVVYLLALALHVVSTDHGLQERFEGRRRLSQGVLAAAVVMGAAAGSLFDGGDVEVDVATALLAGFMMYQVFREELPWAGEARLGWLLTGSMAIWISAVLVG